MHSLFITNGAFQHPAKHMSTWQTKITKNNEIIKWYNQIDCTLCKQNQKQTRIDARSYSNTMVDSDLRIVITKLKIQLWKIYPKNNKEKLSKSCNTKMIQNGEVRNEYKQQLKDKINTIQNPNDGYRQKWKSLCHSS